MSIKSVYSNLFTFTNYVYETFENRLQLDTILQGSIWKKLCRYGK